MTTIHWSSLLLVRVCVTCVGILSVCSHTMHLPVTPLDPLVESLVTCQRLTSLKLIYCNLSLQSWITLVKGLHNLRALTLWSVTLSDERVSAEFELHKL